MATTYSFWAAFSACGGVAKSSLFIDAFFISQLSLFARTGRHFCGAELQARPLLFWALATPSTKVFDSNTPDIGLSSGRSILSSVLDRKTGLSHPIGCFENNKE
jgi:hypothetical protein